jgi:hypothetical protein
LFAKGEQFHVCIDKVTAPNEHNINTRCYELIKNIGVEYLTIYKKYLIDNIHIIRNWSMYTMEFDLIFFDYTLLVMLFHDTLSLTVLLLDYLSTANLASI